MRLHRQSTPTILGLFSCRHGRGIEAGICIFDPQTGQGGNRLGPLGLSNDPIDRGRPTCRDRGGGLADFFCFSAGFERERDGRRSRSDSAT